MAKKRPLKWKSDQHSDQTSRTFCPLCSKRVHGGHTSGTGCRWCDLGTETPATPDP